jgi:general secretion pathway protein A
MYTRAYGLAALPFELTADPRYLFLTKRQREALSILQYGLISSRSLTLLVGEPGTGKTMLLQAALASDRCRHVHAVYLNNPAMQPEEFIRLLAMRFDLGQKAGTSKALFLDKLEQRLRNRQLMGHVSALVIDEAQAITPGLLDEIRLLANIEESAVKLLPLVLAGQTSLADRLEDPSLSQVKQRVSLRCELVRMTESETASYIASRVRTAGGEPSRLFSREAVLLTHRYADGVPRVVNVICHNALVSGMAAGASRIDQAVVADVCRDLRLGTTRPPEQRVERPGATPAPTPERDDAEVIPAVDAAALIRRRSRAQSLAQAFRVPRASNQ